MEIQSFPAPYGGPQFTIAPVWPSGPAGAGPLARIDDSRMRPGAVVPMHEHRNDEIVTYLLTGSLRHSDQAGSGFDVTPDTLMVMNAGRSFYHEEHVPEGNPTAVWLQIFIRPREADLPPLVQHVERPPLDDGRWRLLAGDEDSGALTLVRSDIQLSDTRIAPDSEILAPSEPGRVRYLHVTEGTVAVGPDQLAAGQGARLPPDAASLRAIGPASALLFDLDPSAPVTRRGTIGK